MNEQIFICPNCQVKFKLKGSINLRKYAKLPCPKCKKVLYIKPKSISSEDSTLHMEKIHTEPQTAKVYDIAIQSEIVEDFLRYYSRPINEKKEPIAVIADEPRAFREYLQKWLESIGFRTIIANDGRETLTLLQKNRPDILFINVYLPVIMGINICEKIKAHPFFKTIKVVLIGALWKTDRFRRMPTNYYGADDYIEEVITKQELIDKIKKLIPENMKSLLSTEGPAIKDSDIDYAKRLARIIFSDIEIYNAEKIKNSRIKKINLNELLKDDIEEGKAYYRSKVSPSVLSHYDFFEEYLAIFLKNNQS